MPAKVNEREYRMISAGKWKEVLGVAKYDKFPPTYIDEKLKAFGFEVAEIDGHDFDQIEAAFNEARTVKGKPTVIIQTSVKGKGVSFMENNAGWHGKAPNDAEYAQAMAELKAQLAELEA